MQKKASKRKAITKSVRFEVFKRDSFKCQYCGQSSPEVVLEVDHIHPVSKGGDNDLLNLITSCRACNAGKSDKTLDDNSAIQRQRRQLEELNERREQLEMLLRWREGLDSLAGAELQSVIDRVESEMGDAAYLNEMGEKKIAQWLKKFSVSELFEAIDEASSMRIIESDEDASWFIDMIPKVAAMRRKPATERRLYYIRGILRRRAYCNDERAMELMRGAIEAGADIQWIEDVAKSVRNWTEFREQMQGVQ